MTQLARSMGVTRAAAMVVGIIIGASIFTQASEVTSQVPSQLGVFAVWIASGLLTLIGALVIAELSSAWPQTGGVYVFLSKSYSPAVGFLWGWAMFWTMHTGIVAIIAMVCARYVGTFVELGTTGTRVVAIFVVLILSGINYIGVRAASAVQAALTFIKVFAIVAIIAVAFSMGGPAGAPAATFAPNAITMGSFVSAMVAGLFTFGGWHMVSYSAEETIDPTRTIPRALLIGTVIVTVLYLAMNGAYLHVLPIDQVISSQRVAADLAEAVAPHIGAAEIVSFFVVLSTLGAANGVILAGPRVYLAMASDGLLFRWFGAVHPTYRTPHRAIVLQAVWASVLIGTNTFRALFTRVVYTEWIFFALLAASLYFLRKRADYAPVYKLGGAKLWAGLFVVSSATIIVTTIKNNPANASIGLALVLIGLPVYYVAQRGSRR
ncbi:MAG TPA: amino acid permease [Gemmatimonadaceae bacterium]|nr:amino acid permease [Gemmatimonadaceae bacterium]